MSAGRRRVLALCFAATVATIALLLALARPDRDLDIRLGPATAQDAESPPASSHPAWISPERSPAPSKLAVSGRVHASTGEPVAAARVDLFLVEEGGSSTHFGQATSDAHGTYLVEADLAPLDARAAGAVALRGCAAEPRHGAVVCTVPLDPQPDGELELDFCLEDALFAALLGGRVVDQAGLPVAGARVSVQHERESPRELAQVRSGRDGTFSLLATFEGSTHLVARVAARAEGVGSATTGWITLERGPHDLGNLALNGPGRLAGILRDGAGAPLPGFELAALPPALAAVEPDHPAVNDFVLERETGTGLSVARARTGADGRFELAGLAPGIYTLACTRPGLELERPGRCYPTGDESIELALATCPLDVRVVDPDGAGLSGIAVWCAPLEPASDEGGAPARHERRTDELGRAAFAFPPGVRSVGLFASDPWRGSVDLVLALDAPRLEHTLALGARTEPARLRVSVRGEEDEVLPWYRVELRAERSGARAVSFRILPRSNEIARILPAGRYRMLLTPENVHLCPGDPLPFEAPDPVTLASDRETRVDLVPRRGGRISVAVPGERSAADTVEKEGALHFELARGTDAPRPLHFVERQTGSETLRASDVELLYPGDVATSAPLEPGDYTLRCLAGELLVEEHRIEVVERRVTPAELAPR